MMLMLTEITVPGKGVNTEEGRFSCPIIIMIRLGLLNNKIKLTHV